MNLLSVAFLTTKKYLLNLFNSFVSEKMNIRKVSENLTFKKINTCQKFSFFDPVKQSFQLNGYWNEQSRWQRNISHQVTALLASEQGSITQWHLVAEQSYCFKFQSLTQLHWTLWNVYNLAMRIWADLIFGSNFNRVCQRFSFCEWRDLSYYSHYSYYSQKFYPSFL